MTSTRMIRFILAGALAALPATGTAIMYSISEEAVSGTLGSTPFSNALVTFSESTDTTLISSGVCGYPCAPDVTTNTVTIAGVGTVTLTGGSYFFANGINVFGITFEAGVAYLAALDSSFGAYDMLSSFGPAPYALYGGSAVSGVTTSGGSLSLSWNVDSSPIAQACLGGGCSTSTPEPGSFGLALLGAIPLAAGLLRRRRR